MVTKEETTNRSIRVSRLVDFQKKSFVGFHMPKTKGKTLEEIEAIFSKMVNDLPQ